MRVQFTDPLEVLLVKAHLLELFNVSRLRAAVSFVQHCQRRSGRLWLERMLTIAGCCLHAFCVAIESLARPRLCSLQFATGCLVFAA